MIASAFALVRLANRGAKTGCENIQINSYSSCDFLTLQLFRVLILKNKFNYVTNAIPEIPVQIQCAFKGGGTFEKQGLLPIPIAGRGLNLMFINHVKRSERLHLHLSLNSCFMTQSFQYRNLSDGLT